MKPTSKILVQILVVAFGSQALASEPSAPANEPKAKVSESKGMPSEKLVMAPQWVSLAMIVKDADETISNLTSEMNNLATTEERRQSIQKELSVLNQKRAEARRNWESLYNNYGCRLQ